MITSSYLKSRLVIGALTLLFQGVDSSSAQEAAPAVTKAITEASKSDGIKLSPKAVVRIGLKTIPYSPAATLTLQSGAIVHSLGITGIYRLRDGWYKLIPVTLLSKGKETMTLKVTDFRNTDQIVTEGVALLRVAEMDAFGGGE
ncbi:MAG: hypothetical protein H7333_10430 [Bdellovibrionales bacterium]|nr:hypothetical protein [Oligoflexia bacterium]